MHRATLTAQCPVYSQAATPWLCPALTQEPSMVGHGIKYPDLFGQFGSACRAVLPPGFWWKLTLSWPNPGHWFKDFWDISNNLKKTISCFQITWIFLFVLHDTTANYRKQQNRNSVDLKSFFLGSTRMGEGWFISFRRGERGLVWVLGLRGFFSQKTPNLCNLGQLGNTYIVLWSSMQEQPS